MFRPPFSAECKRSSSSREPINLVRLNDRERTPAETLLAAYDIAKSRGLNYAYVGNIQAQDQQTTYCPGCQRPLIARVGYTITRYDLADNRCRHCGVATHWTLLSDPPYDRMGVNARLLEPDALKDVPVREVDGRSWET